MADQKKSAKESLLKRKQVKLAVNALFKHVKDCQEKKPTLLGEEQTLWMIMALKKTPAPDRKPRRIPLSKPLLPADAEVCLITKREGKVAKELIKTANITSIKKVISFTKLKKNYKSYESKRQLASLYDVFICEDSIYHLLPRTLGKTFFSRNKFPNPVDLKKKDLKGEINKVINSTYLSLGHGVCRIGHTGQEPADVVANIITASQEIAKIVPRGWKNIKSLNIKTPESVSLPIHNSLPEMPIIVEPEEETAEAESPTKKLKKEKGEKGEKSKKTGKKEKSELKEVKVEAKKENDEEKENHENKTKKVQKDKDGNKETKGKKRTKEKVGNAAKAATKKKVKKRKTGD